MKYAAFGLPTHSSLPIIQILTLCYNAPLQHIGAIKKLWWMLLLNIKIWYCVMIKYKLMLSRALTRGQTPNVPFAGQINLKISSPLQWYNRARIREYIVIKNITHFLCLNLYYAAKLKQHIEGRWRQKTENRGEELFNTVIYSALCITNSFMISSNNYKHTNLL